MNNAEVKYNLDLSLKAIEPIRYALFDTAELSQLVTSSQLNILKKYASIFDENEITKKLAGDLLRNHIAIPAAPVNDNFTNGQFVQLPTNVLVVIQERAAFAQSEVKQYVPVKPVTYDELVFNVDNPFKQPYAKLVWRIDYSNKKHELITHGPLVSSYQMRYICIPTDVDLDNMNAGLSIAEAFHDEVVDGAVRAAVEILRVKTQLMPQQAKPNNDNQ